MSQCQHPGYPHIHDECTIGVTSHRVFAFEDPDVFIFQGTLEECKQWVENKISEGCAPFVYGIEETY